eukprot:4611401-Amphidinium_carterae.1
MAVNALPRQHVGFLIGDMNVSAELGEQVNVRTGELVLHYGARTALWCTMTKHLEFIPCGLSHDNKASATWTAIDKVLCNFPSVLLEVAGVVGGALGSHQPPAGSDHWPICVQWGVCEGEFGLPLWAASHPEYPVKVTFYLEADIRRSRDELPILHLPSCALPQIGHDDVGDSKDMHKNGWTDLMHQIWRHPMPSLGAADAIALERDEEAEWI